MSFLDNLRKDKMKALKEKDKVRAGVISIMMSNIALAEKEEKRVLSDDEALKYVQKELKQTKDSLESTPADRVDLIDENKVKLEIIESYLPQQMTKEELEKEITILMKELNIDPELKNKGMLIKETMKKFQGRTDGKTINEVISIIIK